MAWNHSWGHASFLHGSMTISPSRTGRLLHCGKGGVRGIDIPHICQLTLHGFASGTGKQGRREQGWEQQRIWKIDQDFNKHLVCIYIYIIYLFRYKGSKKAHMIYTVWYQYTEQKMSKWLHNYNPWLVFTSLCSRSFLDHPEPSSFFMGFSKHQMTLNSIIFPQISQ